MKTVMEPEVGPHPIGLQLDTTKSYEKPGSKLSTVTSLLKLVTGANSSCETQVI